MKTDFGLYIHIPFCVRKCRYCDFLSFAASESVRAEYINRLKDEIIFRAKEYGDRRISTIYIGGGTPSILPASMIHEILSLVKQKFYVNQNAEVTIEVNPGTVNKEKLDIYREAQINRLSIGLQSTHDEELKRIGRIHSYQDFLTTYEDALEAGFDNINVDLISALPGQSREDYAESLRRIVALKPKHISSYSLQLEEGTYLYEHQNEFEWPDEDMDRDLYLMTDEMLSQAGYHRYEISNYSIDGYESRHNSSYWERKNYLGIGLGASSLMDETRYVNVSSFDEYKDKFTDDKLTLKLSSEEQMEEFMFLGLRLMRGISAEEFYDCFNLDIFQVYGRVLSDLADKGLINIAERIRLTNKGIDISNYVLAQFLFN